MMMLVVIGLFANVQRVRRLADLPDAKLRKEVTVDEAVVWRLIIRWK